MEFVIVGAGKTGRGFIPQYINANDSISFIDTNQELINSLNANQHYYINFFSGKEKLCISNYQAFTWDDNVESVLNNADVIALAVGEQNFNNVVDKLKNIMSDGIKNQLFVTFENGTNPAKKLEELMSNKISGDYTITQCAVFYTTVDSRTCDIISQDTKELPYDEDRCSNIFPFECSRGVKDFELFLERKIYTYNCLSAVISYPGCYYGYEYLADAMSDDRVKKLVGEALHQLSLGLAKKFNVTSEEQREFAQSAITKFSDVNIKDSIQRNVRDVIRKLGLNERIFGPISVLEKEGCDCTVLFKIVGYMLRYECETAIEALSCLVLATGLNESHEWITKSMEEYNKLNR